MPNISPSNNNSVPYAPAATFWCKMLFNHVKYRDIWHMMSWHYAPKIASFTVQPVCVDKQKILKDLGPIFTVKYKLTRKK